MSYWYRIETNPYFEESPPLGNRLRKIFRRLFNLPLLHHFQPLIRRTLAVAEPARKVWIQSSSKEPSQLNCGAITVLSANLWHDWPRHRRLTERMDSFARLVEAENADVILLQEVARTPELHVDEWLAERLDMAYVYSRANGHKTIGFEEGLAVFSRFPLGNAYLKQLGDKTNPFVRRLALGALLETPCGNMLTFSTHLGIGRRRNGNQMAHLRNWISELGNEFPVLIGGDFNAHETETQIQTTQSTWIDTFRHKNPTADGTTHELHWPWGGVFRRHRLDYIFLQPGSINWIVLESRHLQVKDGPHSDHHAVLTRLKPVPA